MVSLKSTRALYSQGVKALVYGQAGAGKTTLVATLPSPIVLSAEAGLLSLASHDIPYVEVATMSDIEDVYRFLASSEEAKRYQSVAIDSISEIAEVVLAAEKKSARDPRQAYMTMQDAMNDIIRAFRDLPGKHVLATAKVERTQDEIGRLLYAPSMPGQKLGQALPYFFDEVLALRVERDADGTPQRALQCAPDGVWIAKDRSGCLDPWEAPDMGAIIRKITGGGTK